MEQLRTSWQGVLLCLTIALPAWLIGQHLPVVGGPVFAILAGMLLAPAIRRRESFGPGITVTSKKILQLAVVLLGFGMNLSHILMRGRQSLVVIVCTITISLLIAFALHKLMKTPAKLSILVGVGSSICGGSAIAATAPVIGADEEEIAHAISVIFLFNVVAALIFPALGAALGLSNDGFALFAGTAINDTSSVTAAATAWDGLHGSNTLDAATIVKLTRTLAIIPITLILALYCARTEERDAHGKVKLSQVFPLFILFFILASVATTVFHLPAEITTPLKTLSKFLIVMAMSAIGLHTDLVKLVTSGGKPIFMGFCCWMAIASTSLGIQHVLQIW